MLMSVEDRLSVQIHLNFGIISTSLRNKCFSHSWLNYLNISNVSESPYFPETYMIVRWPWCSFSLARLFSKYSLFWLDHPLLYTTNSAFGSPQSSPRPCPTPTRASCSIAYKPKPKLNFCTAKYMLHARILQHELGLARSIIPEFVFKKLINTNGGKWI